MKNGWRQGGTEKTLRLEEVFVCVKQPKQTDQEDRLCAGVLTGTVKWDLCVHANETTQSNELVLRENQVVCPDSAGAF